MKTTIAIISLILAGTLFVYFKTSAQIKRTKTLDAMGQISVALDKTIGVSPLEKYDPVIEAQKLFPSIPVKDKEFLDEWGKPVRVSLLKAEKGYRLILSSGGPDGIFETADDIIYEDIISKKATQIRSK